MSAAVSVLRFVLLGFMAFAWLVGALLGPVDRAVQRAVNVVVWALEDRGVSRARIYYANDACFALTTFTLAAVEHSSVGAAVGLLAVACMHAPRAGVDFPRATYGVKTVIVWCGAMSLYGHYLRHDTSGHQALNASYFVVLLLVQYVHRVPRTRPPRRRKAPALQRVPA